MQFFANFMGGGAYIFAENLGWGTDFFTKKIGGIKSFGKNVGGIINFQSMLTSVKKELGTPELGQ